MFKICCNNEGKKQFNLLLNMGELYIIWNDINDKLYVGITTVGYKCRFKKHLRNAKNGNDYARFEI